VKALVTGATGFVGSHVTERLCREGLQVVCLVRPTSRLDWLEGLGVETCVADLSAQGEPGQDAEGLARALADVDYVFHVAGLTRARSLAAYMAVNAEGTRRLAEAAARSAGKLRRFVYVSSLAAAGPCPTPKPLEETDEPKPRDGYGASKLAAERAVLAMADRLPASVVRPPGVYGPRDENFLGLFRGAQRWHRAPILGSATKQLSLVYVTDLVECLWRAATASVAVGQTYFAGSGTYTWADIVAALGGALGVPVRALRVPAFVARLAGELGELWWTLSRKPQILCRRKVRDALQDRWACSWAKAERELGYRPAVSLGEGMRRTAEWYAGQGWLGPLAK